DLPVVGEARHLTLECRIGCESERCALGFPEPEPRVPRLGAGDAARHPFERRGAAAVVGGREGLPAVTVASLAVVGDYTGVGVAPLVCVGVRGLVVDVDAALEGPATDRRTVLVDLGDLDLRGAQR